jgi:hypothetical protein
MRRHAGFSGRLLAVGSAFTTEPTVGRATPPGQLRVTPAATTTFTLTVTGVGRGAPRPATKLGELPRNTHAQTI